MARGTSARHEGPEFQGAVAQRTCWRRHLLRVHPDRDPTEPFHVGLTNDSLSTRAPNHTNPEYARS
jgi:hypothetical protein